MVAQYIFSILIAFFRCKREPLSSFIIVNWHSVVDVACLIHCIDTTLICSFFVPVNCSFDILNNIGTFIVFICKEFFCIDIVLFSRLFLANAHNQYTD